MAINDLERDFQEFHADHPDVYARVCAWADILLGEGHKRASIDGIIHTIRLERRNLQTRKIANNHTAYYARLWLKEHPEHPTFFELRKVKEGTV